jgi:malonate decarboxylase holo-[acyl-carrier-protein] synthase
MMGRHQLIYVKPDNEVRIHSYHDHSTIMTFAVNSWLQQGLPVVMARQCLNDIDTVNGGVCLLLDNKKQRIGLKIAKTDILTIQSPPKLIDVITTDTFIKRLPLSIDTIYVYGSFLWQTLARKPYVTRDSDLDLLFDYAFYPLSTLVRALKVLNRYIPYPIDGEIRFNHVGDIAISELLRPDTYQFLVKNNTEVKLITKQQLYDYYPTLCH